MTATISLAVSILALLISGITAWLTFFRRGTLKMTKPTMVAFAWDNSEGLISPKIFLRMLLYSTAKRGQLLENMYAVLKYTRTKEKTIFNIWVYGDSGLSRGSGLFVGETGVASNHHFMPSTKITTFEFISGTYEINIYGILVGSKRKILLSSVTVSLPRELVNNLNVLDKDAGVFFDWEPDNNTYHPHRSLRRDKTLP